MKNINDTKNIDDIRKNNDFKKELIKVFDRSKKKTIIVAIVVFLSILLFMVYIPNLEIETIIGYLVSIIFFGTMVKFAISEIKRRNSLNKYEYEHPEQIELTRLYRSKMFGHGDKKIDDRANILLALIIFGVVFAVIMLTIDSTYYVTLSKFGMAFLVAFGLAIIIIKIVKQKNINKYIHTLISNKYGICQLLPTPSKKTEGNMRNNYKFSYKILKYKCILTGYYREKFAIYHSSDSTSYKWIKLKYVFEYCYNLEALGVKNVSSECLENEKMKNIIDKLSQIKCFEVYIKEKYLVVEKETIISGYKKEDAERDVNDIELFYNKIVRSVLENK